MTSTSESQSQTQQLKSATRSTSSARKSILALSVFAVGLNAAAAGYTRSPSVFALPDISMLAALIPSPHEKAATPVPEPVVAALKDVQSNVAEIKHYLKLSSIYKFRARPEKRVFANELLQAA